MRSGTTCTGEAIAAVEPTVRGGQTSIGSMSEHLP